MFVQLTAVEYRLKKEKQDEINETQKALYEEDENQELFEDLGIKTNKPKESFLLLEEDYDRTLYNHVFLAALVEEVYEDFRGDTNIVLANGNRVVTEESTHNILEKINNILLGQ